MSRLTNDERYDLRKQLMTRAFQKRDQELAKIEAELFDLAINRLLGTNHCELIATLPQGWMPETMCLYLRIPVEPKAQFTDDDEEVLGDTRYRQLCLNGAYPRRVPASWDAIDLCSLRDSDLEGRVLATANTRDKIIRDKRVLKDEIRTVLGSVTTWNKLYAIWPELKTVTPLPPTAPVQALVVDVSHLNEAIGLP